MNEAHATYYRNAGLYFGCLRRKLKFGELTLGEVHSDDLGGQFWLRWTVWHGRQKYASQIALSFELLVQLSEKEVEEHAQLTAREWLGAYGLNVWP